MNPVELPFLGPFRRDRKFVAGQEKRRPGRPVGGLHLQQPFAAPVCGRDLTKPRSERAGIISGGEDKLAPTDAPTLFLYRMNKNGKELEVWWPQLRFPKGNYILAFSFDW